MTKKEEEEEMVVIEEDENVGGDLFKVGMDEGGMWNISQSGNMREGLFADQV